MNCTFLNAFCNSPKKITPYLCSVIFSFGATQFLSGITFVAVKKAAYQLAVYWVFMPVLFFAKT